MKHIIILLFLVNCQCWSQKNEQYQIYIIKKEKLENGQIIHKEVFIDSLGFIKNNINKDIDKIDIDKINKLTNNFLTDKKIEKFEAGKYLHKKLIRSNLPGENINIYISKVSDLRNETDKNKTYYYYYAFYSNGENNKIVKYDFELYFNIPELEKILNLLH